VFLQGCQDNEHFLEASCVCLVGLMPNFCLMRSLQTKPQATNQDDAAAQHRGMCSQGEEETEEALFTV
jgi:hypothetical protein